MESLTHGTEGNGSFQVMSADWFTSQVSSLRVLQIHSLVQYLTVEKNAALLLQLELKVKLQSTNFTCKLSYCHLFEIYLSKERLSTVDWLFIKESNWVNYLNICDLRRISH